MFHGQLALGTAVTVLTVIIHVVALVYLVKVIKSMVHVLDRHHRLIKAAGVLVVTVLAVTFIHTVEVWLWAGLYLYLGEFVLVERALYFSAVTATTLGYGDITLSEDWQLLSTFEAMAGLILFGFTTAFLLAVMRSVFEELGLTDPEESGA